MSTDKALLMQINELELKLAHAERFEQINHTLVQVSNAVSMIPELGKLYESIHQSLSAIIDTSNFFIALYSPENDELTFPYYVDEKDKCNPQDINVSKISSLPAEVVLTGKPLIISKREMLARHVHPPSCTVSEIWLGVPLKVQNNIIGVLAVQSYNDPNRYSQNDMDVLVSVAGQVASAIESKRAEEALRDSKRNYQNFLENISVGVVVHAPDTTLLYCNQKALQILGLTLEQMIGKTAFDPQWKFLNEDGADLLQDDFPVNLALKSKSDLKDYIVGIKHPEKNFAPRWVSCSSLTVVNDSGELEHIIITFFDITNRKEAEKEKQVIEERLRQAQKMEAIGTLAGGIAHDFNNILSVIIGYTELAKEDIPEGSSVLDKLDKVLYGGNRAKELVQQILTFSRQGETERFPLQPANIVKKTMQMLRQALPTTIEIDKYIQQDCGLILADPTQFNQILMNLCTNAFHAMEESGGKLDISLKEKDLSSEDLVHEPNVQVGSYIQLSVSDTGPGIPTEIRSKIFNPYYTTKETGKGTGMGLSIVHGIVESYGGFISLYSEIGQGTAFHVFLPVINKAVVPIIVNGDDIRGGHERVLFVDDEKILTEMGKDMLESFGYDVTIRNNSLDALETFQNQPSYFDLVITDQTMPGMTGAELSTRLLKIRPNIPIILCSGYSSIISEEKAQALGIKKFALKPLTKKDLARLTRMVLG